MVIRIGIIRIIQQHTTTSGSTVSTSQNHRPPFCTFSLLSAFTSTSRYCLRRSNLSICSGCELSCTRILEQASVAGEPGLQVLMGQKLNRLNNGWTTGWWARATPLKNMKYEYKAGDGRPPSFDGPKIEQWLNNGNNWLVVGGPPLWKIWVRQLGWLAFPIYGKIKNGNQTTNQTMLNRKSRGSPRIVCGWSQLTLQDGWGLQLSPLKGCIQDFPEESMRKLWTAVCQSGAGAA